MAEVFKMDEAKCHNVVLKVAKDELAAGLRSWKTIESHRYMIRVESADDSVWYLKGHDALERANRLVQAHEFLRSNFNLSDGILRVPKCKFVGRLEGLNWTWEERAAGTTLKGTHLLSQNEEKIGKAVRQLHGLVSANPSRGPYHLRKQGNQIESTLLSRLAQEQDFLVSGGVEIQDAGAEILGEIELELGLTPVSEGLLHGDLKQDNLGFDGRQLWMWDLIDLGLGWRWYDIGNLICDNLWKNKVASENFLEAYLGYLPSEKERQQMILGVAVARFIQAGSHARKNSSIDWQNARSRLNESREALECLRT